MRIEKVGVNELRPHPKNPRVHPDSSIRKLERSIREFGWTNPILVSADGYILAGHARLKAAKAAGVEEVPVVYLPLEGAKAEAYLIADNRLQDETDWDYIKLKGLLQELDTGEIDIELTGFGLDEIEQLLTDLSGGEEESKNGAPQVEARAAAGDVWQLGEHRIACGDCTDVDLLERLLETKKVNSIITSPPYAQQRKEEYGGIPAEEYPDWFGFVADAMWTILDDKGSFFLNIKEHVEKGQRSLYVMKLIIAMVEKYGWRYVDELIWTKPGLPGGWRNRLKNDFEPVFWFAKSDELAMVEQQIEEGEGENKEENIVDEYGRTFHFCKQQKIRFYPKSVGRMSNDVGIYTPANRDKGSTGNITIKAPKGKGIARPGNVIRLQGNTETWEHPAMYPVGLPEFFIKLTTLRGDTVFDPFLGAGSTLIAAEKTKRVCYGTELQPKYVDIILARWEQFTGQKAVKLDGN